MPSVAVPCSLSLHFRILPTEASAAYRPIDIFGGFAVAGIESALLRRGVSQLRIRKVFQALFAAGRGFFACAFGMCRSPLAAALCVNLDNICALCVG